MALDQTLNHSAYGSSPGNLGVLDAVNEVLESVGEFPVASVTSSSGTSIESRALKFLERANIRVQSMGWPDNMVYAKSDTGTNHVDGAYRNTMLGVVGSGTSGNRTFTVGRNTGTDPFIYDSDSGTNVTSETIQIDIIHKIPFHQCSIGLQHNIVKTAAQDFQRRLQGSGQADQMLTQERGIADSMATRNNPVRRNAVLPNVQPIFSQTPASGQGQEQQSG
jgi:hypothetical protein